MNSRIASHIWLPEPMLAFHPNRPSDRERHPLRGLLEYGPHSAGFVPDPIRVATLAPHGESQRIYGFMKNLNSAFNPRERRDYLPRWPGFQRIFGLRMSGAGKGCHEETSSQLDTDLRKDPRAHITIADHLVRGIQHLEARRSDFDVLFIYIPQRWEPGFVGGPNDDFDLHDHLKAYTAARGVPIQLVREDSAIAYHYKARGHLINIFLRGS